MKPEKSECIEIEKEDGIHFYHPDNPAIEIPEYFEPWSTGYDDEPEDSETSLENYTEPKNKDKTAKEKGGDSDKKSTDKKEKKSEAEDDMDKNHLPENKYEQYLDAAKDPKEYAKRKAKQEAKKALKKATKKVAKEAEKEAVKLAGDALAGTSEFWGPVALGCAAIVLLLLILIMAFMFIKPGSGGASTTTSPTSSIEGVLDVPYQNQFRNDSNKCSGGSHWAHTGSVGCGITSQAMVESFILKKTITPDDVFDRQGIMFNYGILNNQIRSKGIQYTRSNVGSTTDAEKALKNIEKTVQKGYPGIIHVYPPFASSQHIMVVTGFKENGDVYINDPNCGKDAPPYIKLGKPAGKNNLAPRGLLKESMVGRPYEYIKD